MRKPLKYVGQAFPELENASGSYSKMAIVRVDSTGKVDNNYLVPGALLLNPETIEESIVSNWVPNPVPGQSLPPLQWVHGGPRSVVFDALVTRDTSDFLNEPQSPLVGLIDTAINAVGSIASSFLGVNVPPLGDLFGGLGEPGEGEQLGIVDKLAYYRSLCFPNYAEGIIDTSPPLVVLYMGKSVGTTATTPREQLSLDSDVWVLVDLRIRISKWLPNLTPMEAVCSFKFIQYPIVPLSRGHFGSIEPPDSGISGGSLAQTIANFF